jgi:CO/xanthine dehydrogenase FAD-binding subunit
MKPASFEYARAVDLDDACALLAQGEDVRVIAGGQTLVPLMAMRLARPTMLVDISRIASLSYVRDEGDAVAIGATTRQCVVEHDPLVRAKVPLLAMALPYVGHAPTRARGTVGGSLANADPAAEIALVAVTLGATLTYREGGISANVAAKEFFTGPMMTALPPAACLTAVSFPVWHGARVGAGFAEVSARKSDFAFAAAAAQAELGDDGTCRRIVVGVGAITPVPLRLDAVAAALAGTSITETAAHEFVTVALAAVEPMADLHASAEYRRRAAVRLAVRAIMAAVRAAEARASHAR